MKKKIFAFTLVIAMLAICFGATLAYFTDTKEATNTFTIGTVKIEQHEYERDENGDLVAFTQNKPVVPAVYEGSSIPYASADKWIVPNDEAWLICEDNVGVIDKFVTVENTGTTAAYVRTIVAFEVGPNKVNDPYMHFVCNGNKATSEWTYEWLEENGEQVVVEIDGTYYSLCIFTRTEPLAAGETSEPTVKQIYLDKTATQEIAANYGATFDMLVATQAIQADGFNDAKTALNAGFQAISSTNHPWVTTP